MAREGNAQGFGPTTSGNDVHASTPPMIELREVVKTYKTGVGGFTAIDGITLDIHRGEFLGIIGKSGAGKTTLLNLISGVSRITSGKILFYPQDQAGSAGTGSVLSIGEMSQDELAAWRGTNMGIVYQSFELMPQLDLVNNIMLPQEFAGHFRPGISQERALELLDIVGLSEHAHKLPAHISGGQKQRVAIARALVNDPLIIVADEPTGSLDTATAETILNIFTRLVEQGKTVVMVTHDMEMASHFSRRLVISDGELVDENGGLGRRPARATRDRPERVIEEPERIEVIMPDSGHDGATLLSDVQNRFQA